MAQARPDTEPAAAPCKMPWSDAPSQDAPATYAPDGRTLFFQRSDGKSSSILVSHRIHGRWSKPVVAPFSGSASDQFPVLLPDGRSLIFESDRPSGPDAAMAGARVGHLWRVDKTASGWSTPVRLPDTVNISRRIYAHSIAANGDLYFMSSTEPRGQDPKWRLFRAAHTAGGYAQAEPLPFSDGSWSDVDPYVAPDQSYLVFSSNKRREPAGHEHLFITVRRGGVWGPITPIRYRGDDPTTDDNYSDIYPGGKILCFESSHGDETKVVSLPLAPYLRAARAGVSPR